MRASTSHELSILFVAPVLAGSIWLFVRPRPQKQHHCGAGDKQQRHYVHQLGQVVDDRVSRGGGIVQYFDIVAGMMRGMIAYRAVQELDGAAAGGYKADHQLRSTPAPRLKEAGDLSHRFCTA